MNWNETISLDGTQWRGQWLDPAIAKRSGFEKILAIDGLPETYLEPLARASQVCDTPHTWCVRAVASEGEVDSTTLQTAKEVIRDDEKTYNACIFTLIGDGQLLGAGAIRNKLNKHYQNDEFPVVSRAMVVPSFRGRNIGSLLVEFRMKAVLTYFSKAPKAIHFGTESEKILHTIRRLELPFVHIGDELYETKMGLLAVHDYLWFLEPYRAALRTEALNVSADFAEKLNNFMERGVSSARGAELEMHYQGHSYPLIDEFFMIKDHIGAKDPK